MNHGNFSTFQLIMTFLGLFHPEFTIIYYAKSWIMMPFTRYQSLNLPSFTRYQSRIYHTESDSRTSITSTWQCRTGDETIWDMMDIWWLYKLSISISYRSLGLVVSHNLVVFIFTIDRILFIFIYLYFPVDLGSSNHTFAELHQPEMRI
jgi:hypothetical protein